MEESSLDLLQHECLGCGRMFSHTNSFSLHQRSCKKSKARLSSALASARENFARLKRAQISGPNPPTSSLQASPSDLPPSEPDPGIIPHDNLNVLDSPGLSPQTVSLSTAVEAEEVDIFPLVFLPSLCDSSLQPRLSKIWGLSHSANLTENQPFQNGIKTISQKLHHLYFQNRIYLITCLWQSMHLP